MKTPVRLRARFAHPYLAIPVAAALWLAASLPAQAQTQYFSSSGANSSYPVNLFPINPLAPVLDFTGNTVSIGNSAPGSFAAMGGGILKADSLSVGEGATGSGTVEFTGAGTSALLGGTTNRLQVGNWGTGSLSVLAGAVIDATVNAGACTGASAWCFGFIGNAAGSNATLTVSGAGSEVRTLRNLVVGQAAVFTTAVDGFDFGSPGGTTNAFVNVEAGGRLRTEQVVVGSGPNSAAATGTQGFGTVLVDGAGSRWIATRNTVDNREAFVTVGQRAGGQGSIEIRNGGQFLIDGAGGAAPTGDGINLGVLGGRGALTVTGAGSRFEVVSNNALIQVGRSGAGGEGSFSVLAGATASATLLQIGRDGATGTMLIDGEGSQLTLTGIGSAAGAYPAFANIGRNGGVGNATVSGGGQWLITDGGVNSILTGSPGMILGRDAGASGSLLITGPGSVVEVRSTSLGLPAGNPDNMNPFVAVGYDNPGTTSGQLTIANGGKLLLTGNAVSAPTDALTRTTSLNIGGRGADNATTPGTGTVTVTGVGSEIRLSGYDNFIGVGRGAGGSGTLNVLDQALVTTTSMAVGENTTGVVNINNAQILLTGFRSSIAGLGAGMTVGRGTGGNGVLTISNSGSLVIENNTFANGMSIGGDGFVNGGTGTVALSGGSSLTFSGSVLGGGLNVGRSGVGVLTVGGASTVDISNLGTIALGRNPGGSGSLNVSAGSTVSAGTIGIGGADDVAGGTGNAVVAGPGSSIVASGASGFISVGRSGTGTLSVADQASVSAIVMNVGRAAGGVGTLVVDNAAINLSGQQTTGNFTGAALSIGNRGGSGVAAIGNGSVVTITNPGSNGASLNVGGTPTNPLGTGTLNVSGGSQINVTALPGQAIARIGHDGTGTASFNASSLRVGSAGSADGSIIIAGLPGSVGTLSLAAGSVANAGYVGVGSTAGWTPGNPQALGGAAKLILNNSTINTTTFELGAQGVLSGDGGVINATGDVIIGGTIDPGNSPGRIVINCNLISLAGSKLIIEIAWNGTGYVTDQLAIGKESTFDLRNLQIEFDFVGDTDPVAFAQAGGFDLDNFLRVNDDGNFDQGLSTRFAALFPEGTTWDDVINPELITAISSNFDITELSLQADGSFAVAANAVPEPPTWALMLFAALVAGACARLRRRQISMPGRGAGMSFGAAIAA